MEMKKKEKEKEKKNIFKSFENLFVFF